MPRSMTGQGHAQESGSWGLLHVEIRCVNNRGLKVATRLPDPLGSMEGQVEALLRKSLHRGSVHVRVSWRPTDAVSQYRINAGVVQGYYEQLLSLQTALPQSAPIDLTRLAMFPGALEEPSQGEDLSTRIWPELQRVILQAIANLDTMRDSEGSVMASALQDDLTLIQQHLRQIGHRAPMVVQHYRKRLEARVQKVLAEHGLGAEPVDLLREAQLFADRSDISEEATRLESHRQAFLGALQTSGAQGRKLDFIIQEMSREANTIGSKAIDSEISASVVEIKCALERMRELIQNLE